jgi:hypothetical protein
MDAWTAFLTWLSKIVTPDWNGLIQLLPLFVVIGLLGPVLSLLMLYHLYHFMKRQRPRIRYAEPEPHAAPVGDDGQPIIPANVPYCSRHGLIYPLSATVCELDGEELSVRCPVDETVRVARQQLCRVCGTKYVLGASSAALTVQPVHRPPEGGAAAA